ncbi:hypothetical protein EMCRGX_G012020 [Ephydatia muelleri]
MHHYICLPTLAKYPRSSNHNTSIQSICTFLRTVCCQWSQFEVNGTIARASWSTRSDLLRNNACDPATFKSFAHSDTHSNHLLKCETCGRMRYLFLSFLVQKWLRCCIRGPERRGLYSGSTIPLEQLPSSKNHIRKSFYLGKVQLRFIAWSASLAFVTEVQSESGNAVTNLSLLVENRPGNNATQIQCYSYGSNVATSTYASLTIAGPPLTPSPEFRILNATQLIIAWDKPFTWTSVADILYYTVRMYNSSSQQSMNWTDFSVATTDKYAHYLTAGNVADQCTELTFDVSATSIVGQSKYGSVKGGFPIELRWPEQTNGTSRLSAVLQYEKDGSLLVNCTVQVPIMCNFQYATYSIVISSYQSGNVVAKAITTRAYLKGDPITISLSFKPQKAEDTDYNIILVVSSFGTDLQALTSFNISPTLMPKFSDRGDVNPALIAGVSCAFTALLVLAVVVICFSARGVTKARKGGTKDPDSDHYYEQAPPLASSC